MIQKEKRGNGVGDEQVSGYYVRDVVGRRSSRRDYAIPRGKRERGAVAERPCKLMEFLRTYPPPLATDMLVELQNGWLFGETDRNVGRLRTLVFSEQFAGDLRYRLLPHL